MTIETFLKYVAMIAGFITTMGIITKYLSSKISSIADERIKSYQSECCKERKNNMASVLERIEALEENDQERELTIVKIESTLENLRQGHETTQVMITDLQSSFRDTTSQLIDTIKSFTIRND
jgi:uncharacterized protein YbjQ (UPF0145 family)